MMVVLFDGVCNLCNSTVNWIIAHDLRNQFRFASLQSAYGRGIIEKYQLQDNYLDTVILIEEDKVYLRAQAFLRIFKQIGGLYGLIYIFNVLPSFLLNFFYNLTARNRYRWFGKRETCMVPEERLKQKFIED